MIYLDNAATTQRKPPEVGAAVLEALSSCGNCGRGVHKGALSAGRMVYGVRQKLADFFHAPGPERVAFALNATMALNTAIAGLLTPEDHAISTDWDHNSVLRPLYRLEAAGMGLDFVPAGPDGALDYDALPKLLRPNTKAIVCTHASNLTGDLLDLPRVSDFARNHGLRLILDASQTAGSLPIDMERDGIDVLCFTGHKALLGPQGTGGLCLGLGTDLRPFAVGGTGVQSHSPVQPENYPTRLEAGTLNAHGIEGLGAALDVLADKREAFHVHANALARRFYEAVRNLPGVRVYGDFSGERTAVAALNIGDVDSGAAADELMERFGIAVRPGAHCAPRLHKALGTTEQGAIRFSWSGLSTEEETEAAIMAVRTLVMEE